MSVKVSWTETLDAVEVSWDGGGWFYPIRYPRGRSQFVFSDGTLLQATVKDDKPRFQLLEAGIASLTIDEEGTAALEGEVRWVARCWDFGSIGVSE